jgi:hypothetical protein
MGSSPHSEREGDDGQSGVTKPLHQARLQRGQDVLPQVPPYPLRFEPIYQYRVGGSRRLANILRGLLPFTLLIGEDWVLSDRDNRAGSVAHGPLEGQTFERPLKRSPTRLLGTQLAWRFFFRFPLLPKLPAPICPIP